MNQYGRIIFRALQCVPCVQKTAAAGGDLIRAILPVPGPATGS